MMKFRFFAWLGPRAAPAARVDNTAVATLTSSLPLPRPCPAPCHRACRACPAPTAAGCGAAPTRLAEARRGRASHDDHRHKHCPSHCPSYPPPLPSPRRSMTSDRRQRRPSPRHLWWKFRCGSVMTQWLAGWQAPRGAAAQVSRRTCQPSAAPPPWPPAAATPPPRPAAAPVPSPPGPCPRDLSRHGTHAGGACVRGSGAAAGSGEGHRRRHHVRRRGGTVPGARCLAPVHGAQCHVPVARTERAGRCVPS